jgi:hypothetical protein
MNRPEIRDIFILLMLFLALLTVNGYAQGTVYLVLGSDTAIWEGMSTSRYHNTYNLGLYTDPQRNAYRVMDDEFRNRIVDSNGTPIKLTWWMMAGNIFRYATNRNVPVPNIMTLHLMKRFHLESIEEFGDELSLHYHTFDWFDYSGDGRYWWNQTETFMQLKDDWDVTLAQFLLEENIFPISFRSGWHYMDNEWQQVLDELLPYSLHNDWPAKRTDTTEPLDNTFDWSRAPSEFIPYRPAPDDYQVPGDGKGWNVRSLFLGRVTQQLMDDIFEKASRGIDQVVCLWAHLPELDFLDNIEKVNTHAHAAAVKYPEVVFRYDTAVEAMQRWRGVYGEPQPEVILSDIPYGEGLRFRVQTDKPIFQTVPFVALKDIYENYMIVPMEETGIYEWTSIDSYPLNILAKVGAAVTDTTGNLETRYVVYLPDDIYIDIGESSYTEKYGTWSDSDRAAWFNQGRFATLSANDSASISWSIPIETPGRYNVFVQFPTMNSITDSLVFKMTQKGNPIDLNGDFQLFMPDDWNHLATIETDPTDVIGIDLTGYSKSVNQAVMPAPVFKITPLVRDRELYVQPGFLNIGEVSQNDTVKVDMNLTNRGIEPLIITGISSTGGNIDFDVSLPFDIAPMQLLSVPLRFFASTVQTLNDTVVIYSNDPMRSAYKIPFSADVRLYFKIVDNEDSLNYHEEGNWATSVAQAYGPSSRFSYLQNVGASAYFTAVLNFTGMYSVSQIVPTTVNAANKALYILSMDGIKLDSVYVNQNQGSGDWVQIFETMLREGSTVRIKVTNDGTGSGEAVLRADAVRFALIQELMNIDDDLFPLPDRITLRQNYPNPFNPVTTISYLLPRQMYVSLKVYDLLGREVMTLVREDQNGGEHVILFNATGLPSGTYFYQLQAEDFTGTKKLILLQ